MLRRTVSVRDVTSSITGAKIRHNNHLRDALARLHRVRLRAEIVQADLDFAAVIAVDDTDTVRDMNALFDAETAASENEACRARGDLRRKSTRNTQRSPGSIVCGASIHAHRS